MKKTLLLFAMLLGVVGAWAERTMPTISDEPQNGEWAENTTWYTLKTKNGYYYKTDLSLSTGSKPAAADIASNHKYQWCITGNENDGYKLYNRYQGASQFLGSNNINGGTSNCYFTSEVQNKITTFKFRESTHGDDWWCLQLNGNTAEAYLARNGNGGHLIAWCTGYNTAKGDGGAPITFEEVEDLPEISLTNVQPNGDRLTLYIDATTQTLTFSMDSPKELGAKAKFAYVLHDGKYTFYNEASRSFLIWKGKDLGYNNDKGTLSSYNATYCDWELNVGDETHGDKGFYFRAKRNDTTRLGSFVLLTTSTTTPKSYAFDAYEVGVAWQEGNKQFSNLFTVQINCNLYNEASGSTFQLTHSVPNIGVKPTITIDSEGVTLSDGVFDGGCEYSANITFPFPVSSEIVANPILIGQGTWQNADKKWTVVDGNVKVVNGTPSLGASQWLIYPTLTGTEFTFKIKSVSTDKFVTANLKSVNDAEANNTPVTLTPNGTEFKYMATTCGSDMGFAYTNDYGTVMYLTRNGSGDNDKPLGVHDAKSSHNGNGIRFPEFNEFNVTIGSTGYATLYAPFSVRPDVEQTGITIYQINDNPQNGRVELSDIWYVYKNQGVILKGNPDTYRFGDVGDDWVEYVKAEDWDNNKLRGSSTNTYIADDAYVLANDANGVGLYKADLNFYNVDGVWTKETEDTENGTHFKNNAGKAYLPASEVGSGARFLVFSFGDDMETGITETENGNVKTENTVVYDLAGRRVQGAQKGIFIVNGKKVVR